VQKEVDQSSRQYDDLKARIDHLTALVERLSPSPST
jgi:hypothetical protein